VSIESTRLTVADYKHPEWCDLTRCQPYGVGERHPGGCHESTGTLWGIQSNEADFLVRLVRGDDFDPDGEQVGRAELRVILRQHAWGLGDDGQTDMWAEAGVEPDDARILAAMLTKYADQADRDNSSQMDFEASVCATRAIR
jgi:hypothetical protein